MKAIRAANYGMLFPTQCVLFLRLKENKLFKKNFIKGEKNY